MHFVNSLCNVTRSLINQLIQPTATPEQLNVEHQFISGCNFQLLIDAAVVFFYRIDADEYQIRQLRNFVSGNIAVQDPSFCGRKGLYFFRKMAEHILHIGRQLSGIDLMGGPTKAGKIQAQSQMYLAIKSKHWRVKSQRKEPQIRTWIQPRGGWKGQGKSRWFLQLLKFLECSWLLLMGFSLAILRDMQWTMLF